LKPNDANLFILTSRGEMVTLWVKNNKKLAKNGQKSTGAVGQRSLKKTGLTGFLGVETDSEKNG